MKRNKLLTFVYYFSARTFQPNIFMHEPFSLGPYLGALLQINKRIFVNEFHDRPSKNFDIFFSLAPFQMHWFEGSSFRPEHSKVILILIILDLRFFVLSEQIVHHQSILFIFCEDQAQPNPLDSRAMSIKWYLKEQAGSVLN